MSLEIKLKLEIQEGGKGNEVLGSHLLCLCPVSGHHSGLDCVSVSHIQEGIYECC